MAHEVGAVRRYKFWRCSARRALERKGEKKCKAGKEQKDKHREKDLGQADGLFNTLKRIAQGKR